MQDLVLTKTKEKNKVKRKEKLKPPKRYGVFLLNDDYTPMDFVVNILIYYFSKSTEDAYSIMLEVHHNGSALAGIYTKEIATEKQSQVKQAASQNGYPLRCDIKPLT